MTTNSIFQPIDANFRRRLPQDDDLDSKLDLGSEEGSRHFVQSLEHDYSLVMLSVFHRTGGHN